MNHKTTIALRKTQIERDGNGKHSGGWQRKKAKK